MAVLVDYFGTYAPERFKKRNGQPLGSRSYEKKIYQFGLEVIRTGNGALIDPEKADDKLRTFAERHDREPRRRGRPPKAQAQAPAG